MPHRLVCVAILVGWAVAAAALFTRDLLPNLLIGPPPDLRTISAAPEAPRPVHWAILVPDQGNRDPRSVGQAVTKAERRRDGDYVMTSDAWLDSGELLKGSPFESAQGEQIEIGGEFNINPSGNLEYFRA